MGTKQTIFFLAALVAFAVFAAWCSLAAPCEWYAGQALKNVPARCAGEFVK